ncbi:MAG: hypothetical protein FWF01_00335 [Alphaproteobacteria bacterium]|nr:hypothetical protein [Alphaproteobacteria bacterium]
MADFKTVAKKVFKGMKRVAVYYAWPLGKTPTIMGATIPLISLWIAYSAHGGGFGSVAYRMIILLAWPFLVFSPQNVAVSLVPIFVSLSFWFVCVKKLVFAGLSRVFIGLYFMGASLLMVAEMAGAGAGRINFWYAASALPFLAVFFFGLCIPRLMVQKIVIAFKYDESGRIVTDQETVRKRGQMIYDLSLGVGFAGFVAASALLWMAI